MIDANNSEVWTPPEQPAPFNSGIKAGIAVDDWCTSDQFFDARNLMERVGNKHPGEDVSLTVQFRSGTKRLTKTAESIRLGDNWLTVDGVLRHRFESPSTAGAVIGGWGIDATWGEKRNYGATTQAGGVF